MSETIEPVLIRALSGLTKVEQESLLDYIAVMRGKSVLDDLGDEDRNELRRRGDTIDDVELRDIGDVSSRIKARLELHEK
jgi:hypothetical protein